MKLKKLISLLLSSVIIAVSIPVVDAFADYTDADIPYYVDGYNASYEYSDDGSVVCCENGVYYQYTDGCDYLTVIDIDEEYTDIKIATSVYIRFRIYCIDEYTYESYYEYTGEYYDVRDIDINAFMDCNKLVNVMLPATIEDYGQGNMMGSVFGGDYCRSLENIYVASDNQWFSSVDGVLYSADLTTLYCYPSARDYNDYQYLDSLTSIGEYAFACNSTVEDVIIPDGITSLGAAFYDCVNLKSVKLPDSLDSLSGTFAWCTSLSEITLPESLTYLNQTFMGCTALKSIIIPSKVDWIMYDVFSGCTSLESVVIPEGVERIYSSAFSDCPALKKIAIPRSATYIYITSFDKHIVLYVPYNSYAHQYAVEYNYNYVLTDIPAICSTENTVIDYKNMMISTDSLQNVNTSDNIVTIEDIEGVEVTVIPSYQCGSVASYGTGSVVSVKDANGNETQLNVIVNSDINGDGVVDILDGMQIAKASNGKTELVGIYQTAADTNSDGIVSTSDYQDAVNKIICNG